MVKRNFKKIIVIVAIILLLFNVGRGCFAIELNSADLVKIGNAEQHLQYYRENRGYSTPIICSIVGYYGENGAFFPTYCMNKDLPGAETTEYSVDINSLINNDAVWRVVKNGYPYKTAAEMGLSDDFDAYAVTKFAVYCVLGESELSNYSAIDSVGEQMMNVLNYLVNEGINGNETKQDGTMSISKVGEFSKGDGYYYQDYIVNSTVNISQFFVNISEFPENSLVSDIYNSAKNVFSNGEIFRVIIPADKMNCNINGNINIIGKCQTYPVFYGVGPDGYQDYVVTYSSYGDESISANLSVVTNTGKIKILKVDDETKEPLEGVSFNLKSEDGSFEISGKTDVNGELAFENLYQGKYILTEVETGESYILNEENQRTVEINYNETLDIEIGNTIKKGKIKIIKTDSETNEKLEGITFQITDKETGETVETLVTDEFGEAQSQDLRVDRTYILQEVETLEDYILNDETIEFTVTADEIFEIRIENEKIPKPEPEPEPTPEPEIIPEPTPILEVTPEPEPAPLPKTGF